MTIVAQKVRDSGIDMKDISAELNLAAQDVTQVDGITEIRPVLCVLQ